MRRIAGLLLVLSLLGAGVARGGPPPNDLCADAEDVLLGSVTAGTNVGADGGEPPTPAFCCTSITGPDVWYRVTGTGRVMTASTCVADGGSADFDTKISVFCEGCNVLTCVTGNDDGEDCAGASRARWCSEPGVSYLILIHPFGFQVGNFELAILDGQPCDGVPCGGGEVCELELPEDPCCAPCELALLLQPFTNGGPGVFASTDPCFGATLPEEPSEPCCEALETLLPILPGNPALPGTHPCFVPPEPVPPPAAGRVSPRPSRASPLRDVR